MKKPREYLERISEKLELPRTVTAGLPQTTIDGFGEVTVDLQKGLLSYSEQEILVAVSLGCVSIAGNRLRIRLMKEGRISIVGEITQVTLLRETGR